MPLSKQAKALYEAALRRKGLQPGKAVRQDPRMFVGPIRMQPGVRTLGGRTYRGMVPSDTYWEGRGRFQDLEDELMDAMDDGLYGRDSDLDIQYHNYYNDGDIPRFTNRSNTAFRYDEPDAWKYRNQYYDMTISPMGRMHSRHRMSPPGLTRTGELELEARMDEMIENEYKKYLKKMYSRWPTREDAIREIPFDHAKYLDELYPVK